MSEAGSRGRVKLGELADAALAAAEPRAHVGFVSDLALIARSAEAVTAITERLLAGGDRGRVVFLEWLARLRVRPPEAVLIRLPSVLADASLPEDLRVCAAARVLRSARSSRQIVEGVVAALVTGLTPLAALARLRVVQVRLRRSRMLDILIERREKRLRLKCPRCRTQLGLAEMGRHLFEVHGLILDRGRARRPDKLAKKLRKRYAAARDTTILDQAATLSPAAALRAWAARTRPSAADLSPLLDDAAGRGKGICPQCLAELPASVAPLPAPLGLAGGRLGGEGYVVEVRGPDGLRTYSITTPTGPLRAGLDGRRAVGPRAVGSVAAGAVLAAAVALGLSPGLAPVLGGAAYVVARMLRAPLPSADHRAIDRAWSDLVPRLPPGELRDRIVTRLCRTSDDRGDAEGRARVLAAEERSGRDPGMRAGIRYLQTEDAVRLGIDRVGAIGQLFAAGFEGAEGVTFAEHVAGLFLARNPPAGDVARLRVLALDGAFAAGFTPRALADLWAACPRLCDLMGGVPLSRLGIQYGLWEFAPEHLWESLPGTGTVFELARVAPTVAGRLLRDHPDLLLYHRTTDADDPLEWVLVCVSGLVVRGKPLADAGTDKVIRSLAEVRAEHLLPLLDAALAPVPSHPSLVTLSRRCTCGAAVFASPGRVGRVARFRNA